MLLLWVIYWLERQGVIVLRDAGAGMAAVQAQALHALERWPTSRRPGGASVLFSNLAEFTNQHRERAMRKFVIGTFLLATVSVTGITNATAAEYEVMRCRMQDSNVDAHGPLVMDCFVAKEGKVTTESRTLEALYADNWRLVATQKYQSYLGTNILFFERQKGKK